MEGCLIYTDTITLFNRKPGRSGDIWYPSVLRNIHLSVDSAAMLQKYGSQSQDKAILFVGYKLSDKIMKISGKSWYSPKQWQKLDEEAKKFALTFTDGTKFDFFIPGDWGSEEPISDETYAADDGFYGFMNKHNDYVYAITSISGPFKVIPHFEITGK